MIEFIKKLIAKRNVKREGQIQDIMNDWNNL